MLENLRRLIPLAPLHQPHNLAPVEAIVALHPSLLQLACFDTTFHFGNSLVSRMYALSRALMEEDVMRYGFHGLSYEYIAGELPKHLPAAAGKVVVANLGNGASTRALDQGKSTASTMGFSALDGLPIGTRCGNIDPGVVLSLLQEKRLDANAVSHMLCQESGLLGVSGISNDICDLVQSDSPHAARALDIMVYRIVRELGWLATAMQGPDAIVFTPGIGEHAAQIRERVCDAPGWLGVALDHAAGLSGKSCISTPQSKVSAWVIPTNEELMIAQHVRRLTLFEAVVFKTGPMFSSH